MATKRRTYRVNADLWTVLRDILVGTPEDFNTLGATLRGRTLWADGELHSVPLFGRLSGIDRDLYELMDRLGELQYVIYSYDTPIAWRHAYNAGTEDSPRYWHVPDARYSVTTTKHQGRVRTALSQITGGIG